LSIHAGSRAAPDGSLLEWHTAGLEHAVTEPCLPFFIQWAEGTEHPGVTDAPLRLGSIGLRGDPERIEEWLGPGHGLPIAVERGAPGITRVTLSGAELLTIEG
jgi:hypothetical protein